MERQFVQLLTLILGLVLLLSGCAPIGKVFPVDEFLKDGARHQTTDKTVQRKRLGFFADEVGKTFWPDNLAEEPYRDEWLIPGFAIARYDSRGQRHRIIMGSAIKPGIVAVFDSQGALVAGYEVAGTDFILHRSGEVGHLTRIAPGVVKREPGHLQLGDIAYWRAIPRDEWNYRVANLEQLRSADREQRQAAADQRSRERSKEMVEYLGRAAAVTTQIAAESQTGRRSASTLPAQPLAPNRATSPSSPNGSAQPARAPAPPRSVNLASASLTKPEVQYFLAGVVYDKTVAICSDARLVVSSTTLTSKSKAQLESELRQRLREIHPTSANSSYARRVVAPGEALIIYEFTEEIESWRCTDRGIGLAWGRTMPEAESAVRNIPRKRKFVREIQRWPVSVR